VPEVLVGVVKRLCTICARGGSKGLPNKNVMPLDGKPLLLWTLDQAKACGLFERIAVSSDSPAILQLAETWGAELVLRPQELATDEVSKIEAIRHAVMDAESKAGTTFDQVVDLDVTAPLRTTEDIRGAIALLETSGADNVITGCPARRSPYFNLVEEGPGGVVKLAKVPDRPILRRQDVPACFDMNASIYVWRRDTFVRDPRVFYENTRIYVMPPERSHDIDSELDFAFVELLLSRLRSEELQR
jgi:CMP-N,N'-diacetyllegionaminic acid synthase